jgi:hypothetical protein
MKRINGQALLEVAIFGAIIVMLLGVLISYGLRYNYQQKAMQQAFRKSLSRAVAEPGVPVSSVIISDEHIPNPSDTFGVGSVTPFTGSSGGIIRDYQMAETAVDESSLPRVTMNINGQEISYKAAGFRIERNVPEGSLGRYREIYGSGNIEDQGEGECSDREETTDPNSGEPITTCLQSTKNIRIIDSCAGEVMDYGSAVKQCRMIVDSEACVKECSRGSSDCSACNQPMNVPWYCAGYQEINPVTHAYNFPVLEKLFSYSTLKMLGLQQDYTQNTTTANALRKVEGTSGITTTDTIDWTTKTKRKIIINPLGSTSGVPETKEVTSEVSQKKTESREANW